MDTMDAYYHSGLCHGHLGNAEVAEELGIKGKAASIRYVRALKRLKDVVSQCPGILEYE